MPLHKNSNCSKCSKINFIWYESMNAHKSLINNWTTIIKKKHRISDKLLVVLSAVNGIIKFFK